MASNQLIVGAQNNQDNTNPITARAGKQGETIVSELHGRYYEQAYRGNMFRVANATAQTTSAGTVASGTAFTGTGLYNPLGSGVNLALLKHEFAFLVAFAASSGLGLQVGILTTTGPTAITSIPATNALTSGSGTSLSYTGKAQAFSSITIASTGTLTKIIGAGLTGAITTVPVVPNTVVEMDGSLIIPPGGFVATYTSTASGTASALYGFVWEEVPI